MTTTLDGLRGAIAEMADGGATLDEIASAIVDTAGLDSERRAALWLYARSCITVAAAPSGASGPVAAEGGRVHASGRPSEPGRAGRREGRDMPYVRCPNCGLTSYIVRNRWRAGECPGCGAELWADSAERAAGTGVGASAERSGGGIAEALAVAREQLAMDVALLTQVEDGRETVRESDGEWPVLGSLDGRWLPVEETFCNRLLEGRISNRVPDAANDDLVSDLGMAKRFGVGAWIGVPLELSDARLYMLCCLAREARPFLSDEDVRFLTGLGETVVAELEAVAPS
jgi:GAF domain-containing protein